MESVVFFCSFIESAELLAEYQAHGGVVVAPATSRKKRSGVYRKLRRELRVPPRKFTVARQGIFFAKASKGIAISSVPGCSKIFDKTSFAVFHAHV